MPGPGSAGSLPSLSSLCQQQCTILCGKVKWLLKWQQQGCSAAGAVSGAVAGPIQPAREALHCLQHSEYLTHTVAARAGMKARCLQLCQEFRTLDLGQQEDSRLAAWCAAPDVTLCIVCSTGTRHGTVSGAFVARDCIAAAHAQLGSSQA